MTEMKLPIICLHIPKTAGTSFRVSAEHYFGPDNILRDYGAKSPATSEEVLSACYGGMEIESLRESAMQKKFLTGHFSLAKYRDVFPDSPIVTFFRDPIKRVVSEYVHFSTHYNFEGTLREFYLKDQFQNRQSKILSGAQPSDLDFYGLTEKYEESLEKFNNRYSTKFPMAVLNKGKYKTESEPATAAEIEEIKSLNQVDIQMYEDAVKNFDMQESIFRSVAATVPRYSGNLGGVRGDKMIGWTIDRECDAPAQLSVKVNGRKRMQYCADSFRADILKKHIHINGNCGFEIPLNKLGKISSGDKISVSTSDGSFELPNSPITVGA